ncbi:hypothetical protein C6P45_000278 [Maudiozyma exigua]|uniref:Conserved oligomeric Golgi complex subunit 8 n=1 Tax=Maudiozyma exigua TaxID=34358 RepID=A0A9P6W7K4_MAUEX|nr:hypothetical protein C6P45_000278 [Kazachstania exigua]
MEVILQELLPNDEIKTKEQEKYCIKILEEALQSDGKNYANYFSSRAESGSIVEEIAELDAHMATLERQVRSLLIDNKNYMIETILSKSRETITLEEVSHELEQLWELDSSSDNNGTDFEETKDDTHVDSLFEDFLEEPSSVSVSTTSTNGKPNNTIKKDDEFHKALKTLRQRVLDKYENDTNINSTTNLATIFENLTSITDLMELPSLAETCIKTGHYQEAIMLYSHTYSLKKKFPDSSIINDIANSVQNSVGTTMLTGLVKLLCTNLSMTSIKKILQYLIAIPPFNKSTNQENNQESLLIVYLSMRLKFIKNEIKSYSFDTDNDERNPLLEISIKRQIEVVREHIYMSLSVYEKTFDVNMIDVSIPFAIESQGQHDKKPTETMEDIKQTTTEDKDDEENPNVNTEKDEKIQEDAAQHTEDNTTDGTSEEKDANTNTENVENKQELVESVDKSDEKELEINEEYNDKNNEHNTNITDNTPFSKSVTTAPIKTNPLMLKFVNDCISYLLKELKRFHSHDSNIINNSVCLQLVYCSFRLNDLNSNYHHLFLNKIIETQLFTNEQLQSAIVKRTELASKYSFT